MIKAHFRTLRNDQNGTATVEFAVISFALFMVIFLIVELTLFYFFIQSAQKAAHMGARLAIVSDTAASALPATNTLATGGIFGTSCSLSPSPCDGFAPLICDSGINNCNAASFTRILDRMQNFMPGLLAEHVTVTYAYQGLGYAGGPAIPAVTVRIDGVPHQTGILGVILGAAGGQISTVPAVSVTLTGEDLSTSGA